jgi:diadenosine tetraphosphate (Ap4A) HIT family hydrolase
VILNDHAAEITDLPIEQRLALMNAVYVTESVLRELLSPTKINLASLGNVVPHVHWHVIPRWSDDSHFPDPIWANAKRAWPKKPTINRADLVARLKTCLGE